MLASTSTQRQNGRIGATHTAYTNTWHPKLDRETTTSGHSQRIWPQPQHDPQDAAGSGQGNPRLGTPRRRAGFEDDCKADDTNNRKDREESRGKDEGLRFSEPGPRNRRSNRPKQNPLAKTQNPRDCATQQPLQNGCAHLRSRGTCAGHSPDRYAERRFDNQSQQHRDAPGEGSSTAEAGAQSEGSSARTSDPCTRVDRDPSALTDPPPTDYIHDVAFSSKAGQNIAWDQRSKNACGLGFPPFSSRRMGETHSDNPTATPAWTQQVRAPEMPHDRFPLRFRVQTTGCPPPLSGTIRSKKKSFKTNIPQVNLSIGKMDNCSYGVYV